MTNYDAVLISPHLDDAIYSCGATIHNLTKKNKTVCVVTVFSGLPEFGELSEFAADIHERWQQDTENAEHPVLVRQREDTNACKLLGADFIHLNYLDCIYRKNQDQWLYDSEESLFGPLHEEDSKLSLTIQEEISELDGIGPETNIYAPLALGEHVDHNLVYQSMKNSEFQNIHFYEDYPYAENYPLLDEEIGQRLSKSEFPVNLEDVESRIQAMGKYESQISTFWKDKTELAKKIIDRWEKQNQSEVYWK